MPMAFKMACKTACQLNKELTMYNLFMPIRTPEERAALKLLNKKGNDEAARLIQRKRYYETNKGNN